MEQHNGSRNLMDLANEDNAPFGSEDTTHLQILTDSMTRARDAHLLSLIAAKLNEYGRVLVIYGDGHLQTCRAVLENMLGPQAIV